MNDTVKARIYLSMLHIALSYLNVVMQGQNPEHCALPLSAWIKNVTASLERIKVE